MFHIQNLYLFFIASLLLNLTPGNDMIYVATRTISQGAKAGMISALGIFMGCFVHITAAVFGLSLVLAKSVFVFQLIKFIGAGYLVYLGIKAFISKTDFQNKGKQLPVLKKWKLLKQGIITNALNPKVALFFLAFLPQFIQVGSSLYKIQFLLLGLWFTVQGTCVLLIVALLLGKTKDFLKNNERFWKIQEKITGIVLIGLGIKVAISSRK
jgi:threonine/homoserine/homoserine lactone efflux protein